MGPTAQKKIPNSMFQELVMRITADDQRRIRRTRLKNWIDRNRDRNRDRDIVVAAGMEWLKL